MSNTTTKLEISKLDLESISIDNVYHLQLSKEALIKSYEFAFEATGNIQYLNDIIKLEEVA